jgi:hypothetical protein
VRYLHPVSIKEKFVASGVYTYWSGDQVIDYRDEWCIHRQPDGSHFSRIDLERHAYVMLSEVLENPDGHIERVDVKLYSNRPDASDILAGRASYTVMRDEGYIQVGRTINNGERETFEIELKPEILFNPPYILFSGRPVRLSAEHNGKPIQIVSVNTLHELEVAPVTGRFIGEEMIEVDQKQVSARCYSFEDKQSFFWFDEHYILLKSINERGEVAQLSRYVHV